MKRLILILMFFLLLPLANCAEMLDADYNFIEHAFEGIKPVTDKQFNDAINKMTPQPVPDTFGGKLKTFLFGRKYGTEPAPLGQENDIDTGGEAQAVKDIKNGVYYIKLVVSIVGEGGKIIPVGNYKIKGEKYEGYDMLVFYQGADEYGKLRLRKFEDTQKGEHDIAYSRIDIISDDVIRIVYSTIDDTKCAVARVYQQ